jgi:hypothetical protein
MNTSATRADESGLADQFQLFSQCLEALREGGSVQSFDGEMGGVGKFGLSGAYIFAQILGAVGVDGVLDLEEDVHAGLVGKERDFGVGEGMKFVEGHGGMINQW